MYMYKCIYINVYMYIYMITYSMWRYHAECTLKVAPDVCIYT